MAIKQKCETIISLLNSTPRAMLQNVGKARTNLSAKAESKFGSDLQIKLNTIELNDINQ